MSCASRTPKLSRKLSSNCTTQGSTVCRTAQAETVENVARATVRCMLPTHDWKRRHGCPPQPQQWVTGAHLSRPGAPGRLRLLYQLRCISSRTPRIHPGRPSQTRGDARSRPVPLG